MVTRLREAPFIYIPEAETEALKVINSNGYVESYRVRPSNLEDVFLTDGKRLR